MVKLSKFTKHLCGCALMFMQICITLQSQSNDKAIATKSLLFNQFANITIIMTSPKRKPIKIRKGTKKMLADACGVSLATVYNALHWDADTTEQNLVRERAKQLGFVRKF